MLTRNIGSFKFINLEIPFELERVRSGKINFLIDLKYLDQIKPIINRIGDLNINSGIRSHNKSLIKRIYEQTNNPRLFEVEFYIDLSDRKLMEHLKEIRDQKLNSIL